MTLINAIKFAYSIGTNETYKMMCVKNNVLFLIVHTFLQVLQDHWILPVSVYNPPNQIRQK